MPEILGMTRSVSLLLMPWFLVSLGHHQPWEWLYDTRIPVLHEEPCFQPPAPSHYKEMINRKRLHIFMSLERVSTSKGLSVVRFDGLICVTQASGNLSLLRDLRQTQEFTSIPGKTIFPGLVAMSGMWNKSHENAISISDPLCRDDDVMAW